MKSKALIFSLVLFTAGIAFVGSGVKKEADIDEILKIMSGTWINSEYDTRSIEAKFVCHPDGTFDTYNNTTDTGATGHLTYTIMEAWYDRKGDIWYNASYVRKGEFGTGYELGKLANNATVWESVWSRSKVPEELDPLRNYVIYYRQE